MKYFLLSDNVDTIAGLSLVGIRGLLIEDPAALSKALEDVCRDEEVAIVLITEKLVAACQDIVFEYKLKSRRPLIVEMPDRESTTEVGSNIKKYIAEVVGIKI